MKEKGVKKEMMCNYCGDVMIDALTTFTVVRGDSVYVVKEVPCLKCPVCGHVSFPQDVAMKLERYTSGRVISRQMITAYMYMWNDPDDLVAVRQVSPASTASVLSNMYINLTSW